MSLSIRPVAVVLASALAAAAAAPAVAGTGTIYASRMPDGTLSLGDRPTQGAVSTSRHTYATSTAAQQAAADRAHARWHEESLAFSKRRADDRLAQAYADAAAASLAASARPAPGASQGSPLWVGYGGGLLPQMQQYQVPVYTSSPGALQGMTMPVISGGFGNPLAPRR